MITVAMKMKDVKLSSSYLDPFSCSASAVRYL